MNVLTYGYDMENRLVSVSGGTSAQNSSFKCDPLGRLWRISIGGVTTDFLYDGDALVAEYTGSVVSARYVHGNQVDEPWVQYSGDSVGSSSRRYLYADHQGSIIANTNSTGADLEKFAYDNYGIPGPNNEGRFGYTGQAWLKPIGLFHYKARMYHPKLGRFLQTDPVFYADDMNMYAYVHNDPVNNIDPNGEFAFGLAAKIIKVAIKGGDIASTVGGIADDFGTLTDSSASFGDRALAGLSLASEIVSPVSLKDAKAGANAVQALRKTCCFVAGTLVETEDGLKPIEEIEIGDRVWSRNADTGETALKEVTDLIRRHKRVIWEVVLAGPGGETERFETTDDHPWWIAGRGWITTDKLAPGMAVVTRDGRGMVVASITEAVRNDATYNLTVADFETYFVGEQRVLVHNCDRKTLRVDTAGLGDKVKTPDTDQDQFTKLRGGQEMKDKNSGLIWQKSNTNHSGDSAGEFKVGTSKGEQPTKSNKITVTRSDGCVFKKDGC